MNKQVRALMLLFLVAIASLATVTLPTAFGHRVAGVVPVGDTYVHSYRRKVGTNVRPNYRSAPEGRHAYQWACPGAAQPKRR